MSKYGWTLWGSIQDGISDLDFDFWGWAMEKYDRAVAEFDGPEFEQLLADVKRAGLSGGGRNRLHAVASLHRPTSRNRRRLGRLVLLGHLQVRGLRPLHEHVVDGADDHDHAEHRPQHRLAVQPVPVEVERPALGFGRGFVAARGHAMLTSIPPPQSEREDVDRQAPPAERERRLRPRPAAQPRAEAARGSRSGSSGRSSPSRRSR